MNVFSFPDHNLREGKRLWVNFEFLLAKIKTNRNTSSANILYTKIYIDIHEISKDKAALNDLQVRRSIKGQSH
jgi:hypothetical protein